MMKIEIAGTMRVVLLGLLAAMCAGCGVGATPHPAPGQASSVFGVTPIFDEEFNESSLNTAIWNYRTLGVRDSCTVTTDAVTVANGYARVSIYTVGTTHYCGSIATSASFNHSFGYWEAAVRYKYQPGMSAAWWIQSPLIGSKIGNPQASGVELDVFEHTSNTTSSTGMDHAVHWDGYTAGIEQSQNHPFTFADLNDGNFHKYAVAWTPASYTFYVDDVVQWTLSTSQAAISNMLEYVILSTEVQYDTYVPSGGYGLLGASTNAYIDIDYVRVYPYLPTVTTTNLSPIADTYVQDGSLANTNFGSAPTLAVKGDTSGNNRNAYLMFDLSSVQGNIQQATLYMTPVSTGGANLFNTLYAIPSSTWTESTLTWSNQPSAATFLSTGTSHGPNVLTNFDASLGASAGQKMSLEIGPGTQTGSATEVDYGSRENATAASRPTLTVLSTSP